ncbi:unnamed protein product [Effrenium voratum]|uniref:ZZ-type domain-containing protein n=1 Tax=Effrenium voratum TaxID=2562239 RepID=A0AA36MZB5_9DINO|nr:unnamed protein product [Effrenium voratum]
MQMSYGVRVTGPTKLAGKYERSGALNGMPLYIGENGQRIWFDQGLERWCLSESEEWQFTAQAVPGVQEPPRAGWEAPDESWGVVPPDAFQKAALSVSPAPSCSKGHQLRPDVRTGHSCDLCRVSGTAFRCPDSGCDYDLCAPCHAKTLEELSSEARPIPEDQLAELLAKLRGKDSAGNDVVYRRFKGASLQEEWAKMGKSMGTAEDFWTGCVAKLASSMQEAAGFSHGVLLETEHPYSAKRFSWRKVVQLKTDALEVFFHSRTGLAF